MIKNYIKIALRNLLKHKGFSLINIAGLAIGMTCSILILLWVQDELSYDRFHQGYQKIYRITSSLAELNVHAAVTPAPLGEAVVAALPEVDKAVRVSFPNSDLMQVEERSFEETRIVYVDSNFFEVFSFPLIQGDLQTALRNPDGVLLTQSMAKKYFGDAPALGKVIRKNHQHDLAVTGILADAPANSHLQFDFIQPMAFLARDNRDFKDNIWDNFNYLTYVKTGEIDMNDGVKQRMEDKITEVYRANEKNLKVNFILQPLSDIHLYSKLHADIGGHGDIQYIYIFIVVAIFILVVACINFMNLATARSARRAKEVGLRKVAGPVRRQLIGQFLAESSIIAGIALILALSLVTILLPYFNDFAGKQLSVNFLQSKLVAGLLGITLLTGLLAGSYPALFLSSFSPAKVLKGNLKAGASGSVFRNTMVVIQFTVSIVLVVGTIVVYNQLHYIKNRNLGYDKENLVYFRMTGDIWEKYQPLRTALEQHPLTANFAFVSDLPIKGANATIGVEWEGKDPNSQPLFSTFAVEENFVDVFGIRVLYGRGFSKSFTADTANYLVNETALKTMGMEGAAAVGKPLTLWGQKGTIIGVVKDFNFMPAQQPIAPLILRLNTWGGFGVIRTRPQEIENTIAQLEKVWKELNPAYPFSSNFLNQDLDRMYMSEQRLGTLFNIFAGLAIFISCLGLYGLSAFLAERRTKEIGVRKVLGASELHVAYLLSQTFTKPVLISMLIATPLAWWAMNTWLQGFAFRISIEWTVFVIAFLIALAIAWITVSFESIKAAMANPAESLRSE